MAIEIIRPTASIAVDTWTSENLGRDGDAATGATISQPTNTPSITYGANGTVDVDAWDTPAQTWTAATLKVLYARETSNDDTVALRYGDYTSGAVNTIGVLSVTSTAAVSTQTFSAALSEADFGSNFADIGGLRVLVDAARTKGGDGHTVWFGDAWVEGEYTEGGPVTASAAPIVGIITTVGNVTTVENEWETQPTNGVIETVGYAPTVRDIQETKPTTGVITTVGYAPQVEQQVSPTTGVVETVGNVATVEATTGEAVPFPFALKRRRARKPDIAVEIDWSHPLTKNLGAFVVPIGDQLVDLVSGEFAVQTATTQDVSGREGRTVISSESGSSSANFTRLRHNIGTGPFTATMRYAATNAQVQTWYAGFCLPTSGNLTLYMPRNTFPGSNIYIEAGAAGGQGFTPEVPTDTNIFSTYSVKTAGTGSTPDGGKNGVYTSQANGTITHNVGNTGLQLFNRLGSNYSDGTFSWFALHNRELSDAEFNALHDNPWQILKPVERWIDLSTTAAVGEQTVEPSVGIITTSGYAPTVEAVSAAVETQPTTGVITTTGYEPTVRDIQEVKPTAGVITTSGYAPTVRDVQEVKPTAGVVTTSGYVPTVRDVQEVKPTAGVITTSGYAPTVRDVQETKPTAGVVTTTGYAPTVRDVQETKPTAGVVTTVGYSADVTIQHTLQPSNGVINVVGYTHAATTEGVSAVSPNVGIIETVGNSPTLEVINDLDVTSGVIDIVGYSANLQVINDLNVTAGVVEVSGYAPDVGAFINAQPTTGVVNVSGYTATVEVTEQLGIVPTTGVITLVGYSATLTVALEQTVAPSNGVINTVGYTPTVRDVQETKPTAGVINTVGNTPTVEPLTEVKPSSGVITVTGNTPSVALTYLAEPASGLITFTGYAPQAQTGQQAAITPTTGVIETVGLTPTVDTRIWIPLTADAPIWTAYTATAGIWTEVPDTSTSWTTT